MARAVAALNHPNILGLYDIGNENGVSYIVTEFVAGETLAALLERGPLAMRKLLDIAVQAANIATMADIHATAGFSPAPAVNLVVTFEISSSVIVKITVIGSI